MTTSSRCPTPPTGTDVLGERIRSGGGTTGNLQRVLQELAAGVEPARLLASVLTGALQDAHGRDGVVLGLVEGATVRLATSGAVSAALQSCAEESAWTGRTVQSVHSPQAIAPERR